MTARTATESHATILVIDDDKDSLEIISLQLKQMGYKVLSASSIPEGEAVALAQAPDLIIIDPGLPNRDGIEAAGRLKQNPKTALIPIVVHTVWDKETYKLDAEKAGITDCLLKPTSPELLKGMIQKILPKRTPASKDRAEIIGE